MARHGLTVEEIEEMSPSGVLELDDYEVEGERRFEDLGSTARGRIIKMITTNRKGLIRVVTAYTASPAERRYYMTEMVKRYE